MKHAIAAGKHMLKHLPQFRRMPRGYLVKKKKSHYLLAFVFLCVNVLATRVLQKFSVCINARDEIHNLKNKH